MKTYCSSEDSVQLSWLPLRTAATQLWIDVMRLCLAARPTMTPIWHSNGKVRAPTLPVTNTIGACGIYSVTVRGANKRLERRSNAKFHVSAEGVYSTVAKPRLQAN